MSVGVVNIIRIILRISLTLTLFGVSLMIVGGLLIGASIYLSVREAVVPTNAAAASSNCDSDENCNSTRRYTIKQLPQIRAKTNNNQDPLLLSTSEFTTTSEIETPLPLSADPTVSISTEVTPAPTQPFRPLTDATGDEPVKETDESEQDKQNVEVEAAPIRSTTTLADTEMLQGQVSTGTLSIEPTQARLTASETVSPTQASAEFVEIVTDQTAGNVVTDVAYVEPYTSTDQVKAPPILADEPNIDSTEAAEVIYACPTSSDTSFDLIPIEGQPIRDHPAAVHGDLNLVLRGYIPTNDKFGLVDYSGDTDPNAPQLSGLFEPNRIPQIRNVYRINDWNWDSSQCGGHPRGCPAPPADTYWQVTLVGFAATPGEPIYVPERGPQIYRGGFVAMVLYAEKERLTLGYTRRDHVVGGYVVHIDDVCVNPNLVALYRSQLDGAGWNDTGHLPAVRNDQALGTALGYEIKIAVRDAGSFMDPRSRKDWWR